jgi:hypothetical protein
MVDRFRVDTEPNAALTTELLDLLQQGLGNDAFAVITDDNGRGSGQLRFQFAQQASCQRRVKTVPGFAVDADDLLFLGNYSGLDAGAPSDAGDDASAADVVRG